MSVEQQFAEDYLIFKCLAGSKSYGTDNEHSDTDIRGVFIAPPSYTMNPFLSVEQVQIPGQDAEIYELAKFVQLAAENNPNIIELLYVDESNILFMDSAWERIRSHRHLFLSKKARYTFSGYGYAQLKRIKGHNKWINSPAPEREPQLLDYVKFINGDQSWSKYVSGQVYNIQDMDKVDANKLLKEGFLIKVNSTTYRLYYSPDFCKPIISNDGRNIQYVDISEERLSVQASKSAITFIGILTVQEETYKKEHKNWKDYWAWKRNRNPARAELEEKFMFDCYSADTEFLTETGWKMFDDVDTNLKLATINVNNHRLEYQNYTNRHHAIYYGKMYSITGHHTDVRVSSNHRMFILEHSRNLKKSYQNWKFEQACYLPDSFKTLNRITPRPRQYRNEIPCGLKLQSYLRLMGWYVSEGSVACRLKDGTPSVLTFSQLKGGRMHWHMSRAIPILSKMGVTVREYCYYRESKNRYEMSWTIAHRQLAKRLVEECGTVSKNKHLPRWVMKLGRRMQKTLLNALHIGDGTDREPNRKKNDKYIDREIYCTSSPQLADDVQELAFLSGHETSKWGPFDKGQYHVHISSSADPHRMMIRNTNVKSELVSGERIVCFSVKNETLVTRRNGCIAIHGNCKHAMHLVRLLRMCREILTEGKVTVKRPDANELIAIRNGEFSYEEILAEAEKFEQEVEAIYNASTLQNSSDKKAIGELYINVIREFWSRKGLV